MFRMYDHRKVEKEMLEFWEKNGIYQKAKERNRGKETFYFCDGPPYATGQIHPGTAWNKSIKDAVCRYQARGSDVRAQAGFDTHGLPIEVKVEQELKFKHKREIEKYGMEKFVEKCKAFATQYIGVMGASSSRCGVWMDWDNPYITYQDSYIESSWKTLQMAHEQGPSARGRLRGPLLLPLRDHACQLRAGIRRADRPLDLREVPARRTRRTNTS